MRTILLFVFLLCPFLSVRSQKIAGPLVVGDAAADGFILFAPLNTKGTYLIDNCGRVINSWTSEYFPGNTFYLMENGNLVRTKRLTNAVITGGGGGGGIEIFDWNSNLLWSWEYNTQLARQHHDIALMPNGNILVLAWVLKTRDEAIAAGRDPALIVDDVLWSEELIEIKPVFPNGADIVWRWSLWDHLIQDFDPTKANYGVVEDHPELVNLNYTMAEGIDDWIHANAIDYNPVLNQIIISSPFLNEFWIIDHSTTVEQAATHVGGTSGKGGDLLYRWGNPKTYKKGTDADTRIFGQHHVHWIDEGLPHEGKIMLFNNNAGLDYSTIEIIDPPLNPNGSYSLVDGKFGPANSNLTIQTNPPQILFSRIMSGAEMLPNGNVLINSSLQGKITEISPDNEIIWEYRNPVTANGIVGRDYFPAGNVFSSDPTFRAIKYSPDFIGFQGKSMEPAEPIEGEPWFDCETVTAVGVEKSGFRIFPNPAKNYLRVEFPGKISARLHSMDGHEFVRAVGRDELTIDLSGVTEGLYFLLLNNEVYKVVKN